MDRAAGRVLRDFARCATSERPVKVSDVTTLQALAAEFLTLTTDADDLDDLTFADEVDALVEIALAAGADDAEGLVGLDVGETIFEVVVEAAAETRLTLATMRARAAWPPKRNEARPSM